MYRARYVPEGTFCNNSIFMRLTGRVTDRLLGDLVVSRVRILRTHRQRQVGKLTSFSNHLHTVRSSSRRPSRCRASVTDTVRYAKRIQLCEEVGSSISHIAGETLHICPTDVEPSPGFYTNFNGAGPGTYFIHLLKPVRILQTENVSSVHTHNTHTHTGAAHSVRVVFVQLFDPSDAHSTADSPPGHELVQRLYPRV